MNQKVIEEKKRHNNKHSSSLQLYRGFVTVGLARLAYIR